MNKILKIILKVIFWILVVFIFLFVGLASLGFWHQAEIKKTNEAINRINNRVIDLSDVMGKNLPPKPDQALNDSTIAGIDVNNNGIRDDVELAIFEKYPNSAKIRAAELQYAQALQLELTEVFNSETLVATIKKEDSAYFCIGNSIDNKELSLLKNKETEVESFVLNTNIRKNRKEEIFRKYMTTYSLPKTNCDINLNSLPN